jgi:phenylacetate-CoA ligase
VTDAAAVLIRHLLFPAWVGKNRSRRLAHLRELEQSQFWPADAIRELQWTRLRTLLDHASRSCPFYARKFRDAGLAPGDIRGLDDIRKIPVTSKEEIQRYRDDMIAKGTRRSDLVADMTGGSTGQPLQFFYDRDRLDSRTGATMRHDRWAGWDIGEKMALLWGSPRDLGVPARDRLRAWILGRQLVLDASALDEERMRRFAERLREYRPKVILAYANTMAAFARFVARAGITGIRPQGIICSAEVLTGENRTLIEATFGCPVFNRYGSREFAVIASECRAHRGMHVNAENLLVEALVAGRPSFDEEGELVVTDLRNFAMPMIRYRTGDVGRLKTETCICGRGLPLMDISGGRTTDFLTGLDGRKVSGIVIATYVITNLSGIGQVQFVQRQLGRVEVNVVKGEGWSESTRDALAQRVRAFLGQGMNVDIRFRDDIALEASGKYRFSISSLQDQLC